MVRGQVRRALTLMVLLLAIFVFVRQIVLRGKAGRHGGSGGRANQVSDRFSFESPKLERGERTELIRWARRLLQGDAAASSPSGPERSSESVRNIVFLSLGRPDRTALVARGEGGSVRAAIGRAADELAGRAGEIDLRGALLKLDLAKWRGEPEAFDERGRATLEAGLDGIWLPELDLILLPEELLARRLIDDDGDLQSGRLRRYLDEGGRGHVTVADSPGKPGSSYFRVRFDSFVEAAGGAPKRLFRGNDLSPEIASETLLGSARLGGDYLLRHQREDGSFDYSYEPRNDTLDDGYNLLRHAGTCYALVELHQATGDPSYLTAARRGLEWLLTRTRGPREGESGTDFDAVVSPDEEAKLGGTALAILAMVQVRRATDDDLWADRLPRLARFLIAWQDADGQFESKYFYGEPDPEPFESIYYPGEAILALVRLYGLDPRPEWLAAARRGADWLIEVRDAGKSLADLPHDHWLLMGLEELHGRTADRRYLEHAERIARAIVEAQRRDPSPLDWVGSFYDPPRSTPTATRSEALVAMHRLAASNGLETRTYLEALVRMAAFQRRCQLTPESVLYLPRPDRALGGFRRSLTDWEVRIDYVQHNLSALLGLRAILAET